MSTTRSVERTFAILQLVARHPHGIGVTDIAKELALAKSTVSRYLSTMQAWEVVERTKTQQFRLGSEPQRWVSALQQTQTLSQRMLPLLHKVVKQTGESAALCVLDEGALLYQENVQSQQDIQMRDWKGERVPAHAVSPGKVLLAYAAPDVQQRYLQQPLTARTPKTVVGEELLRSQLAEIREQGYAIADEEYGAGIIGMSIPIMDPQEPAADTVVAALCVYGPKFRLDTVEKQAGILQVLETVPNLLNNAA